jgi:hypothetical protein
MRSTSSGYRPTGILEGSISVVIPDLEGRTVIPQPVAAICALPDGEEGGVIRA